jgi:hypothetical protein
MNVGRIEYAPNYGRYTPFVPNRVGPVSGQAKCRCAATKAKRATSRDLAAMGITVEYVNADGVPVDADETEGNS